MNVQGVSAAIGNIGSIGGTGNVQLAATPATAQTASLQSQNLYSCCGLASCGCGPGQVQSPSTRVQLSSDGLQLAALESETRVQGVGEKPGGNPAQSTEAARPSAGFLNLAPFSQLRAAEVWQRAAAGG